MIRTYFQMLVDEITIEEAAEAARTEAIIAQGQIAREKRNRDAVGKMKQFAAWFTHGVPGGGALRKQIFEAKNGSAVIVAVEHFFETHQNLPDESDTAPVQSDAALLTEAAYCD
jgi:tRNA-dihydrouridine synthase